MILLSRGSPLTKSSWRNLAYKAKIAKFTVKITFRAHFRSAQVKIMVWKSHFTIKLPPVAKNGSTEQENYFLTRRRSRGDENHLHLSKNTILLKNAAMWKSDHLKVSVCCPKVGAPSGQCAFGTICVNIPPREGVVGVIKIREIQGETPFLPRKFGF